jgi:hypothetical protein
MSSLRLGFTALATAMTILALALLGTGRSASTDASAQAAPAADQRRFASPEAAAAAVIAAVKAKGKADLLAIFGREAEPLLTSGDPVEDAKVRQHFIAEFDAAHHFDQTGDKAVLVVGKDDWPFPIPLERRGDHWRFDTAAGEQEILDRRIGENELSTIQVMLAYVDAQREYNEAGPNPGVYARRLLSTPGKHDGLYWPTEAGETPSPLGPLIADARAEGYRRSANAGERAPFTDICSRH